MATRELQVVLFGESNTGLHITSPQLQPAGHENPHSDSKLTVSLNLTTCLGMTLDTIYLPVAGQYS